MLHQKGLKFDVDKLIKYADTTTLAYNNYLSDDIIKTRTKSATSYNCCLYIFRFEVYFLPWTSAMDPGKCLIAYVG